MDDAPAHRLPSSRVRVARSVAVDRGPIGGIAVTADGRRLLATNYGDDTVSIIDTVSCSVVDTVFQADEPFSVAVGPASSGWAYVTAGSNAADAVLAIDVNTAEVAGCYPVAMDIGDLVADPTSSRVYFTRTCSTGVDVLVLDADMRPCGSVNVASYPGAAAAGLRVSANGRWLYVAVRQPSGDTITVLDRGLNIIDVIAVGASITDLAASPDGGRLYVATADSDGRGRVDEVDARTHVVRSSRAVQGRLVQLMVSRDGRRVYLVSEDAVLVVCAYTNEVLARVAGIVDPSCAAESPDGSRLYIAGFDGTVSVARLTDLPAPALAPAAASLREQLDLDDAVSRMLQLQPAG